MAEHGADGVLGECLLVGQLEARLGALEALRELHVLDVARGTVECLDDGDGVVAVGGLAGEHDAVDVLADHVGDVAHLGEAGGELCQHGLEHLRGDDDLQGGWGVVLCCVLAS